MKKALVFFTILLALIAVVAAGCGGPEPPTATPQVVVATPTQGPTPTLGAPKTLKIGWMAALSGPAAPWGVPNYRGVLIAKDDINTAGGIVVGNERYLLDIVAYDDQNTATVATTVMNQLIFSDKVKYVTGLIASTPTLATAQLGEENKVIRLTQSLSDKALGPDLKYTFRTPAPANPVILTYAAWLAKRFPEEAKRVAIINPNDALGTLGQKRSVEGWQAAGATLVWNQLYDTSLTDFNPLLTDVLKTKPTLLDLCAVLATHQGLMIQQARDLGYKGPISTYAYQTPQDFLKMVKPEYLEGYIFSYFPWDRPDATAAQKAFYQKYVRAFGEPFMTLSIHGYTQLNWLKESLVKAGTLDTTAVASAMEKGPVDTLLGSLPIGGMQWYGADHELGIPTEVSVFQDGKPVYLTTLKLPDKW